jgi:hypothetical protein
VRGRHRAAARRAPQQALEQRAELVAHVTAAASVVALEESLRFVPGVLVDAGGVFAGVLLALVPDLARVDGVGQQAVQRGLGEGLAAALDVPFGQPELVRPPAAAQFLHDGQHGLVFEVQSEDGLHPDRLVLVDHQAGALAVEVVAKHGRAAGPLALAARRPDLVPSAFADDLPLELREGQEDVQHQPAHAGGRAELLRDGHEADAVFVERLYQAGEVQEGAAEPIDLVDDDHVHLARLDVGQQPPQRRPLHVAAGEAAVVVAVGQAAPALVLLAGDEGFP